MDFLHSLMSCSDPTAAELAKFLFKIKLYRKRTYLEDTVALIGMAVNDPSYFAGQPLTKCPPNMVVVFPKDAPSLGDNFLLKELIRIRKAIREIGLRPDNPALFCQVVTQAIDITPNVSESYRLAIGFVILDLFTQFASELKEQFWTCGDKEFLESWLNIVKKQRLDSVDRLKAYIDEHYHWDFIDENRTENEDRTDTQKQ